MKRLKQFSDSRSASLGTISALAGNLALVVGGMLLTSKISSSFSEIEHEENKVKLSKQNKIYEIDRIVDVITKEKFKINSSNRRMDIQEFVDR